jgi:K(+)-stimulated pyrophosphate-energized sodium pump
VLWVLIAACMTYYFGVLSQQSAGHVVVILLASVLGILGSYGVAWFGIRINTVANSRAAFSALKGNPLATLLIPLKSGMSVGLLLVAIELFFMICILAFLPQRSWPGPASSALRSASPSAPRPCASAAASSPRSPTSAPT